MLLGRDIPQMLNPVRFGDAWGDAAGDALKGGGGKGSSLVARGGRWGKEALFYNMII
jgi:hypothetical protein